MFLCAHVQVSGMSLFNFTRECQINLHSHQQCKVFQLFWVLVNICYCQTSTVSNLGLIYISLIINEVHHLSINYWSTGFPLLCSTQSSVVPIFPLIIFLLICRSSLHILDTHPLSVVSVNKYLFTKSVACPFIFFMVSIYKQKLCILMQSSRSIFLFTNILSLKKPFLTVKSQAYFPMLLSLCFIILSFKVQCLHQNWFLFGLRQEFNFIYSTRVTQLPENYLLRRQQLHQHFCHKQVSAYT